MSKPKDLQALTTQRASEAPGAGDIYALGTDYVGYHQAHKRRIARLDAVVDNQWGTVWPDGTVSADDVKVADNITSDLEDIANLVAGPEPSSIIPADTDVDSDQRDAAKRRQILATYREINNRARQRYWLAIDLVGTGLACEVIWPDFDKGYPRYIRVNPRNAYPDPDLTDPTNLSSLVVAYRVKARILERAFPNADIRNELFTAHEGRDFDNSDVTVYEYHSPEWSIKVAGTPKKGVRNARSVTLAQLPVYGGKILANISTRTTFDGQLRGQFDKAIAPLGTANKMMEMKLAQMADEIFATKIIRGVFDNPDDYGPGATLYTTDPQASISREETARSSPDFYNDIQMMINASRESSGVPPARHGDVQQSIISAQGINALNGKYVTLVSTYQSELADLERRSNSKALCVDEHYLDFEKELSGVVGGRSFSGTYTPSVDIAGRYENRVTYGAGSAMDSYNATLSLLQQSQYGVLSLRHIREQMPGIPDPLAMEADIAREGVERGILATYQDPAAMDMATRLRFATLVAQGNTVLEVAGILEKELAAAQAAAQADQASVEEALGPGATPEDAQQQPYLPPLASLRGTGG